MKGLITAGGQGTRMRPLTFSTNKHFVPLANKPLLFYALEAMAEAGIKEIGINYNPGQLEEIKGFLGTGKRWGVRLTFILQEKPAGLAHVIKVSRHFLKDSKFVMHLGDNIFFGGIKELVDRFEKEENVNALLTVIHHPENWRMGVPYFERKGRLIKIVEKPKKPPHDLAVPGLYFFDANVWRCFQGREAIKPSARGELEIVSLYNWLLRHGYRVEIGEFDRVWKDPGKFDDWLDTNRFLLDQMEEEEGKRIKGAKVEGRVRVGKKCRFKNVLLRGPLIIGEGVEIENSFLGPYSSVGDRCQIKEAKIENSILMEEVKIFSPRRPLDSCLIGRGSVIEGNSRPLDTIELFLGNQCLLKL